MPLLSSFVIKYNKQRMAFPTEKFQDFVLGKFISHDKFREVDFPRLKERVIKESEYLHDLSQLLEDITNDHWTTIRMLKAENASLKKQLEDLSAKVDQLTGGS